MSFSSPTWLWPTLLAGVLAWLIVGWSYRPRSAGPQRWACAALKALAIAGLAFCLLDPLGSGQRARPGANLFAVVADNSQNLQIKDQGEPRSRGEFLRDLLRPETEWQRQLTEQFEVRRFLFDARLNATRDFHELAFDGPATALGGSLRNLAARFRGRHLAGILLLTDGNATDLRDPLPAWNDLPPVYPVVLGRPGAVRDLAIARLHLAQSAFEDAPVSLRAEVSAAGFQGQEVVARLTDLAGRTVAERKAKAARETLTFDFQWRPEKPGLSFFRLRVGAGDEIDAPAAQAHSREATLLNNARTVAVDRGRGPYRILYVGGRPNWEYKFLNRAIQHDDQVQLVALVRIARREPKFDFRGRAGETSNPLFRGFDAQAREEVERFDQPVLVRLNTRDELELRAGFPRAPEDLFGYHAVILDHVEAGFFAPDQALLLQRFVSERGGGFLMLGGAESYQQGQYQRTPIGDMLPVYLDRSDPAFAPKGGTVHLDLTREGWLETWARLRDNQRDEQTRRQLMPPFQVFNPLRELKPGAGVVLTAKDDRGTEYPALVTQRFGRGRTAACTVGDLWRWGMRDPEARQDLEKTWRQLLRWLVNEVPNRVELAVEPGAADPNGAVQLQVRVRDAKFQPLDDAAVSLEVQPVLAENGAIDLGESIGTRTLPDGRGSARGQHRSQPTEPRPSGSVTSSEPANTSAKIDNSIHLRAEPSLAEPGLYEATYVPRQAGGYRALACVTNAVGGEVGRAEAGWSTDLAAEEFRSLDPNLPLLETLARRTGGEIISPARLLEFARNLSARKAPVMESWSYPLWHNPWCFGFSLACLLAEWGLRRWKGLP